MEKLKVLITGGSGFVGKRLIQYDKDRFNIIPLNLREADPQNINLSGIDSIIHLAGKAHQMAPIADKIYFDVNYRLTKQLALRAIEYRVPHF